MTENDNFEITMKELHCSKSLLFYYFVKHFSIRIQQCIKSYLALYCILLSMNIWILVSSVREGWISFYSQRHLSCYIGDFFVSPIEFSELCAAWKLLIRCIYIKKTPSYLFTLIFSYKIKTKQLPRVSNYVHYAVLLG